MRLVGTFEQNDHSTQFADYLLTLGISVHAEELDGHWEVWVRDEDHLDQAKSELELFLQNPADVRYQEARSTADQIRQLSLDYAAADGAVLYMSTGVNMAAGRWLKQTNRQTNRRIGVGEEARAE